jgi:hypothetical protein
LHPEEVVTSGERFAVETVVGPIDAGLAALRVTVRWNAAGGARRMQLATLRTRGVAP